MYRRPAGGGEPVPDTGRVAQRSLPVACRHGRQAPAWRERTQGGPALEEERPPLDALEWMRPSRATTTPYASSPSPSRPTGTARWPGSARAIMRAAGRSANGAAAVWQALSTVMDWRWML